MHLADYNCAFDWLGFLCPQTPATEGFESAGRWTDRERQMFQIEDRSLAASNFVLERYN